MQQKAATTIDIILTLYCRLSTEKFIFCHLNVQTGRNLYIPLNPSRNFCRIFNSYPIDKSLTKV